MNNFKKFITFCLFSFLLVSQSYATKRSRVREDGEAAAKRVRFEKLAIRDAEKLIRRVENVQERYFGICYGDYENESDNYHVVAIEGCGFLIFNIDIAETPLKIEIFQLCLEVLQRVTAQIEEEYSHSPDMLRLIASRLVELLTDLLNNINYCPDGNLIDEIFQRTILFAEMPLAQRGDLLALVNAITDPKNIGHAHGSIQGNVMTRGQALKRRLEERPLTEE